jgi:hypothetical protein
LAIDGNRLGLDTGDSTQNHDSTVQNAQRSLDLDGEINVTGGINQVEVVLLLNTLLILLNPVTESGRGLDGNTLLTFQVHGVHLGTDAVTPADLVDSLDTTSVEKNSLCTGGFTAVDMGLRRETSLDKDEKQIWEQLG